MINIRRVKIEDAEAFLKLNIDLDHESRFMMVEPGEREQSVDKQVNRITTSLEKRNNNIFVAEDGDVLAGYIEAEGGGYRRNSHKIHIVIGILSEYSGKGIGTKLFEHLERWAKDEGFHRFELTVMKHNERAISLYKKMGFLIEGEIRDSLLIEGEFIDEFLMSKILN